MFVCHYTRGHPRPPEAVSALPTRASPTRGTPEPQSASVGRHLTRGEGGTSPEVHPCLGRPSGALPPEAQAARGPPERKPSVRASNRVGGLVVHHVRLMRNWRAPCVHLVCTSLAPHVHCACTLHASCVQLARISCTLYVHPTCTLCALCAHLTCTSCAPRVRLVCQRVHLVCIICTLCAPCVHLACASRAPPVHSVCTLRAHAGTRGARTVHAGCTRGARRVHVVCAR